jgi:hypothetical protein
MDELYDHFLLGLLGFTGDIVVHKAGTFQLAAGVLPPTRAAEIALINDSLPLGCTFSRLQSLADGLIAVHTRSLAPISASVPEITTLALSKLPDHRLRRCAALSAVSAALNDILADYRGFIASLRPEPGVTLAFFSQIHLRCTEYLFWFPALESSIRAVLFAPLPAASPDLVGGLVISRLRAAVVSAGSPPLRDALVRLCRAAEATFIRILRTWLTEGVIRDPFDEFFIVDLAQRRSTSLSAGTSATSVLSPIGWHQRWKLRPSHYPSFLLPEQAETLLFSGRMAGLLRERRLAVGRENETYGHRLAPGFAPAVPPEPLVAGTVGDARHERLFADQTVDRYSQRVVGSARIAGWTSPDNVHPQDPIDAVREALDSLAAESPIAPPRLRDLVATAGTVLGTELWTVLREELNLAHYVSACADVFFCLRSDFLTAFVDRTALLRRMPPRLGGAQRDLSALLQQAAADLDFPLPDLPIPPGSDGVDGDLYAFDCRGSSATVTSATEAAALLLAPRLPWSVAFDPASQPDTECDPEWTVFGVGARSNVPAVPCPPSLADWGPLVLKLHVPRPIDLFITPHALVAYSRVFRFCFTLRSVASRLAQARLAACRDKAVFRAPSRHFQTSHLPLADDEPCRSPYTARAWLLMHRASSFLAALMQHVTTWGIAVPLDRFWSSFWSTADLREALASHALMLAQVQQRSLLASRSMRVPLTSLLHTATLLTQSVERVVEAGEVFERELLAIDTASQEFARSFHSLHRQLTRAALASATDSASAELLALLGPDTPPLLSTEGGDGLHCAGKVWLESGRILDP